MYTLGDCKHAEISHCHFIREKRWHDEAWGGNESNVAPSHCHAQRASEDDIDDI